MQWYGDLLGLLFLVFLLAGAANLATGGGELFRKLTLFLVATVPVLVLLGLVRAVALLRRGTGASWRDALGAFFIWQSTSLVVARASVLGLFARKAAFLRTPKTSEQARWWEALRANWAESRWPCSAWRHRSALTKATQLSGRCWRGCCCSPPWAWPPRRSTAGLRSGPRCRLAARAEATEYRRDRARSPPARPPAVWSRCGRGRRGHGPAAGAHPPPGVDTRTWSAPRRAARRLPPPRLRRRPQPPARPRHRPPRCPHRHRHPPRRPRRRRYPQPSRRGRRRAAPRRSGSRIRTVMVEVPI